MKKLKFPSSGAQLSNNLTAFRGGFRLWHLDDVKSLSGNEGPPAAPTPKFDWRVI